MDLRTIISSQWLWDPIALGGLVAVVIALRGWVPRSAECPKCRYQLRTAPEGGCPECGWRPRKSGDATRRRRKWKLAFVGMFCALGGGAMHVWATTDALWWIEHGPAFVVRRMAHSPQDEPVAATLRRRYQAAEPSASARVPLTEAPALLRRAAGEVRVSAQSGLETHSMQVLSTGDCPAQVLWKHEYSQQAPAPRYVQVTVWTPDVAEGALRRRLVTIPYRTVDTAAPGSPPQDLQVVGLPEIVQINGVEALEFTFQLTEGRLSARSKSALIFVARVAFLPEDASVGSPIRVSWLLEPASGAVVAPALLPWVRWLTGWPLQP